MCGWRANKSLDLQSAAPQEKFPSWMLPGHSMDSKVLHSGSCPAHSNRNRFSCHLQRQQKQSVWALGAAGNHLLKAPLLLLLHLLSTGTSPPIKGLGRALRLLLRSRGAGRTSQAEPCARGWRDKGSPKAGGEELGMARSQSAAPLIAKFTHFPTTQGGRYPSKLLGRVVCNPWLRAGHETTGWLFTTL